MPRSSSEIRQSIRNLENKVDTQEDRLNDIRRVKYFLDTAYVGQVNAINEEIYTLYDNLLDGISNGTGDTNTIKYKHGLVSEYIQNHSDKDTYLSISLDDLDTEEANTNTKISSLKSSISSEWSAYHAAVEREEEEARQRLKDLLGIS